MSTIELVLLAVALSMDAFAVAVCKGLNMRRINYKNALILALFFGGFQALMPFIGWLLGTRFEKYITSVDHWIAFILLSIIGVQMIVESFKKDDEKEEEKDTFSLKDYFTLAIATSIDALAAGISFACLSVNIVKSVSLIGAITLVLSFLGVVIGNKFGARFKNKAEFAGGAILVIIALKILLQHLGVINF